MGILSRIFGRGSSGPDGSSPSKAIRVESIEEEYVWMDQNCPDFQPGMQLLQEIDGKPFDVLKWRNAQGEERTVFFDISGFFGKRKRKLASGPPCPTCGVPLRTAQAKQCFECGADWHERAT